MNLKQYGGVDGIMEDIIALVGCEESIYDNDFWTAVVWCLNDYKRLLKSNKRQKVIDDGWEKLPSIGDRHEMGG